MNKYIIPIIILIIIMYGIINKNNIYEDFLEGAKDGLKMMLEITPTIIAMIFAVNIFLKSGILNNLVNLIDLSEEIVSEYFVEYIPSCE